MSMTVKYKQ